MQEKNSSRILIPYPKGDIPVERITKRLILRPVSPCDAPALHAFFTLPEEMRLLGLAPAHTRMAESETLTARWAADGQHHALLLRDSGTLIGYIAIQPDSEENRPDTREVGFGLLPEWQHHGYMAEAVAAVLDVLQQQGIRYVWACCLRENTASERLIRRCGFQLMKEGVFFSPGEKKEYASLEFCLELGSI